jgi:RsiW-degrading membrane proteinase PrsW (M82 family)
MAKSNSLYLIIGAMIIVIAGLSFYVYREESKPEGVSISIGQDGVKVQEE